MIGEFPLWARMYSCRTGNLNKWPKVEPFSRAFCTDIFESLAPIFGQKENGHFPKDKGLYEPAKQVVSLSRTIFPSKPKLAPLETVPEVFQWPEGRIQFLSRSFRVAWNNSRFPPADLSTFGRIAFGKLVCLRVIFLLSVSPREITELGTRGKNEIEVLRCARLFQSFCGWS